MSSRYDPNRDITDTFISTVTDWIAESGEVFVLLSYIYSAGREDYALCHSKEDFLQIVENAPIGTDIQATREKQFLLRGIASESLIDQAIAQIPDGKEYLVLRIDRKTSNNPLLQGEAGESHQELWATLNDEDFLGLEVAVGIFPRFVKDSADGISAAKGGIDGPR
jgi:hypothetical protein